MKNILVLYSGGRAFSRFEPLADYFVQASDEDLEARVKKLSKTLKLDGDLSLDFLKLGEDLTGANYDLKDANKIGQAIADNYNQYDGFVVLHGQDTIPWLGTQLAFSLQNLNKTVVLADGSEKDSSVLKTDDDNQIVITASTMAAYTGIPEVGVLSSDGTLVRAVDAIQFNANKHCNFIARNGKVLAKAGIEIETFPDIIRSQPEGSFLFVPDDPSRTVNIYDASTISSALVPLSIATQGAEAVVIKCHGRGSVALDFAGIRDELANLRENRVPAVAVIDTPHGSTSLVESTSGHEMLTLGVIEGGSMTDAVAVSKLRHALSMQVPYEDMKDFMNKDVCGEMESRPRVVSIPRGRAAVESVDQPQPSM